MASKILIKNITPIHEPYPKIEINEEPLGIHVLVQIKRPSEKVGSLYIPGNQVDNSQYTEEFAIVIGIGSMAYRYRADGSKWPDYEKFPKIGEEVRIPPFVHGWTEVWKDAPSGTANNYVKFALVKDNELLTRKTGAK